MNVMISASSVLTEVCTPRCNCLRVNSANQDRIDIKAVACLWGGKRRWHGWFSVGFGVSMAAGLVAVVLAVGWWHDAILEAIGLNGFEAAGSTGSHAKAGALPGESVVSARLDWNTGGLVLAAAVGLAIYALLRQLGRLFLTNLAQFGDADERIAMIDTFLSLEKEGKLSAKEDRILILQALFRPGPGTGGCTGDDGMPPHWFDLLMRRLEPGKGGKDT